MTGMGGMPDGRPLTMVGWPGEGVSAGDEGRLLYTQHTHGAVIHPKKKKKEKKQPWLHLPFTKSFCRSS